MEKSAHMNNEGTSHLWMAVSGDQVLFKFVDNGHNHLTSQMQVFFHAPLFSPPFHN